MKTATGERAGVPHHSLQPETAAAVTQGSHRNHYAQFMTYLRRNLRYVHRLIAANDQPFSSEISQQALHTLSYAFGDDELWPQVRELLQTLAPKMELTGHREDWLPYLERGLEEATRMGDFGVAAEYQYQIGLLYRLMSNYDTALQYFRKSIVSATANNEPRTTACALNELAWIEQLQGQYEEASQHVEQALHLLDEFDPERAVCYRVQGMIAIGRQDWIAAEALHTKALEGFTQHGDLRRRAWSLQNLAYALSAQQNDHEAINLYEQARQILDDIGDKYHLTIVLTNLGLAYCNTRNTPMAIACYKQAENIALTLHDKLLLGRLYNNFGLVYLATDDYKLAQDAFSKAIQLLKEMGLLYMSLNSTDGLVMALLAQGQYDAAIKLATNALEEVHAIEAATNFQYLKRSLQQHLAAAKEGAQARPCP